MAVLGKVAGLRQSFCRMGLSLLGSAEQATELLCPRPRPLGLFLPWVLACYRYFYKPYMAFFSYAGYKWGVALFQQSVRCEQDSCCWKTQAHGPSSSLPRLWPCTALNFVNEGLSC